MTLFPEDINIDDPFSSEGSPGATPGTPTSPTAPVKIPVIPDVPRMEIIFETAKRWVAVTGGKPALDWLRLETSPGNNSDYKTEPLRFRGQDNSTATKTFLERETAISNVLRSGDDIHLFAKDFNMMTCQKKSL